LHEFIVKSSLGGIDKNWTGDELYDLYQQISKDHAADIDNPALANVPLEIEFKGQPLQLNRQDWQRIRAEFERKNPRYTYMLLFMLVVVVLWFGCNNAAKEIVKEEAIYGRERAVNLGIFPYLASKFLVLSVITTIHSALLMGIIFGSLELLKWTIPGCSSPLPEHRLNYPALFGVLVLLSMDGVALGLLLSACVSSPDRANALLPYVLIPQLILGGGFLKVTEGVLYYLAMALSPVYWAYRAVHLGGHHLADNFPGHVDYQDHLGLPCAMLCLQTMILLLATAYFLKRKEAA
jgi:hypothetical protein